MSSRENIRRTSKFTRGEKCIFIHLVVTFTLILVLSLVYFAHLWRVPHAGRELLARRALPREGVEKAWAQHTGLVSVGERRACGGILVRARWAVAPAHCVAARSHPDLADALSAWRIAYRVTDLYIETNIIRGVVHSHFNREDFSNNIGLFEQEDPIFMDELQLTNTGLGKVLQTQAHNTALVWWLGAEVPRSRARTAYSRGIALTLPVSPLPAQLCRQYMAPVVELRPYELCVRPNKNTFYSVEHGAALVVGSDVKGFVAWGDKDAYLPLVVLDIGFYKNWIDGVINVNNVTNIYK